MYHTAREVERIEELRDAYVRLSSTDALTGASDHGATKSVYGVDPDGNEFEIRWMAPTRPVDLERAIARFGGVAAAT